MKNKLLPLACVLMVTTSSISVIADELKCDFATAKVVITGLSGDMQSSDYPNLPFTTELNVLTHSHFKKTGIAFSERKPVVSNIGSAIGDVRYRGTNVVLSYTSSGYTIDIHSFNASSDEASAAILDALSSGTPTKPVIAKSLPSYREFDLQAQIPAAGGTVVADKVDSDVKATISLECQPKES